ncbi:hypothetical protein [Chryseobacterium sp. MFBS3-17]|uniref:hypothetical protein n=1 Tax=Chryseobacterium sp. MFBS3-17 TaxID=2886689 RepID=UPI001D0E64A4|nr:hypothetical protein [Chryseobacterium sp. MFBS3-17]MCC2591109.1 hypothetical protein [Chryseobacterium sp. MFBS3-17]
MEHLHHIKKYIPHLFIFCFLGLQVSCIANNAIVNTEISNKENYTVYKIDSINNYYLIYLNFKEKNYKVISKKELTTKCEIIKQGDQYSYFNLERIIKPEDYIPKNVKTGSPLEFVPDCIKFDEQTEICRDRGMDNIYSTPNLIGLCYKAPSSL